MLAAFEYRALTLAHVRLQSKRVLWMYVPILRLTLLGGTALALRYFLADWWCVGPAVAAFAVPAPCSPQPVCFYPLVVPCAPAGRA